jgi:hypothetical protein
MDLRVLDRPLPFLTEQYGNSHTRTHFLSGGPESPVDEARRHVAGLFGMHGTTFIDLDYCSSYSYVGLLQGDQPPSCMTLAAQGLTGRASPPRHHSCCNPHRSPTASSRRLPRGVCPTPGMAVCRIHASPSSDGSMESCRCRRRHPSPVQAGAMCLPPRCLSLSSRRIPHTLFASGDVPAHECWMIPHTCASHQPRAAHLALREPCTSVLLGDVVQQG